EFLKRVGTFTRHAPGIYEGSVESLHESRVASRRLRELVPILGLDRETTRGLGRRLKWVTQELGVVRQLDVLTATLAQFEQAPTAVTTALLQMRTLLEQERTAAREKLIAGVPLKKIRRLAERLEAALGEHEDVERRRPKHARLAEMWALDARLT